MAVFWTYYPHNWSCLRALSPPLTPVFLLRIPKHGIGSRCLFSGTCQLSPTKSKTGFSHSDGWLWDYLQNQVSIQRTRSVEFAFEQLLEVLSSHLIWRHIILYIVTGFQSSFGNNPSRLVVIEREVFVLSCKFLDPSSIWDSFFRWSMPWGYAAGFFFTCRNLPFYIIVVRLGTMHVKKLRAISKRVVPEMILLLYIL